jgi:prepilin-type processing-associated H-X9-DG protein
MNNMKQLQVGWVVYAGDFDDRLVLNWVSTTTTPPAWAMGFATDPTGVTNGLLYPYNPNMAIYICPDEPGSTSRTLYRTTSMVVRMAAADDGDCSANPVWNLWDSLQSDLGPNYPIRKKTVQISNPGPSSAVVFGDESVNSVDDCVLGMVWYEWWNSPTIHHARGCVFSYADGHVERWQWHQLANEQAIFTAANNTTDDLNRLLSAVAVQVP